MQIWLFVILGNCAENVTQTNQGNLSIARNSSDTSSTLDNVCGSPGYVGK